MGHLYRHPSLLSPSERLQIMYQTINYNQEPAVYDTHKIRWAEAAAGIGSTTIGSSSTACWRAIVGMIQGNDLPVSRPVECDNLRWLDRRVDEMRVKL